MTRLSSQIPKNSQPDSPFSLHRSFHLLPTLFLLHLRDPDPNESSVANGRSPLEGFECEGEEEVGFGGEREGGRGGDGCGLGDEELGGRGWQNERKRVVSLGGWKKRGKGRERNEPLGVLFAPPPADPSLLAAGCELGD